MSLWDLMQVVALLLLILKLLNLVWSFFNCFLQFFVSKVWRTDLRKFGRWAVVTGPTSGIGKAYALELARRGLDIVLVGRSEEKLQMVSKEIEETFGRQTISIQVDFTEGKKIYPVVAQGLQGLEVGVLVNNVGMVFSNRFERFLDIPHLDQKIDDIVNVNIVSLLQMIKIVLPGMVQRKSGLVISLSSVAAERHQPLLAPYSASKVFTSYFSQSLDAEYKSRGVTFQCVSPALVSTNMTHNLQTGIFVKTAESFVSDALDTVGYSINTHGCLAHSVQDKLFKIMFPDFVRLSSWQLEKLMQFSNEQGPSSRGKKVQ